ncbi:MAG: hypothetical protein QXM22_04970 [Candidatus Bathyarchaeia archaeon]
MTGKTTNHNRRRVRSLLVIGIFALLGVGEIILVLIGAQKLDDPRTWLALTGAIFILGLIVLAFVSNVYGFIVKRHGPTYRIPTPSASLFEAELEGFDSRYEELLRQIDRLPDTGREKDRNRRERLREIVIALKEIKNKLAQMSGTYPYKEDLEELEKQLFEQIWSSLDISSSADPLWERLRTHNSEFRKNFIKAECERYELTEMIRKNLEKAKKGVKNRI